MYYKIKVNKDNIEVLAKLEKAGRQDSEYMYITQEELDKLNPKILIGYDSNCKDILT